ncbi:hypothetical protein [Candidatus Cardinium hertigii]|nr:hypothetical protein [Candidatus Cardinium hertigii]
MIGRKKLVSGGDVRAVEVVIRKEKLMGYNACLKQLFLHTFL